MEKTKIIATLGPASNTETMLRKMFVRGLNEVRLNFSHGTHAEHIKRIRVVRKLDKKMHRAVKIMQDLEGYRIRVGRLSEPVELKKREIIYLTQECVVGKGNEIPFDYAGRLKRIKRGTPIYIDDGKIVLKVKSPEKKRLKTEVVMPGVLKEQKGINIPDAKLEFEAITEKDKKDVKVGIREKLDYISQSFVSSAKDLKALKRIVKPKHPACQIIAKVENKYALRNIDSIIDEADGIMVARGDLGVCIPIYKVPVVQKEIVKKCRLKNKPVIVATQMLDSMTEEILPTRAEVCDVANAILDGATHMLLSGETAVGRHPHRVVDMMKKIARFTENYRNQLASFLM